MIWGNELIEFALPSANLLQFPERNTPLPPSPFQNEFLTQSYNFFMKSSTPMTIAIVYFSFVHFINPHIRNRQIALAKEKKLNNNRLPAAPFAIAKTSIFNFLVLVHNVFLCVYSAWTFIGMCYTMKNTSHFFKTENIPQLDRVSRLVQSVCDLDQGIFADDLPWSNLHFYGYWFYLSKFYEVLDTIIILLKGRPSSLLQSYHHAGAMMCMWAGIRYRSPPIWIFVVFNSFIHTLMYFYFSLSCLKFRVPTIFKRILTTMQITQFIVGGSIAVVHAFLKYTDFATGTKKHCIESSTRALPLYVNVAYLAPLTALFAAFYVESYLKRSKK
ncbi:hypothetical protein CAAN1_03S05050 [[Candida] anglica]|uniref:Elongation of fatty acids protein n=1 Tax=[Candida] anglica TaxID=148631 RepID=A0ABP0EH36_9ASCO